MNVERIVVRLFADVSSYLTSFNKAETRLKSFQDNMAKAESRLLRSVEAAELRHANSAQNAQNRFNQITKLANRNYDFAIKSYDKLHADSMRKATQRQAEMIRQSDQMRNATLKNSKAMLADKVQMLQRAQMADDAASARALSMADRRFSRLSERIRLRYANVLQMNTPASGGPRSAQQQAVLDAAADRRDMQTRYARSDRMSRRNQITQDLMRRSQDRLSMMREAGTEHQARVQEADMRRQAAVQQAAARFQRAQMNADRIRGNAGAQSVEARDKAIQQARLRYDNAIRNANFRRTMSVRAADLQYKDDKMAAVHDQQQEAMRRSGQLRDTITRDLRIINIAAVAAFGFVAYEAIKMGSRFELARIELEVMTGSAEKSVQILKDLQTLGVESPFTTADMISSAKQVKAFGFETEQIIPILSRVGDVASGTGADMDRIILAFGQVRTTGRLMGQELRQFTNAGVPILEYLAKTMGKTEAEIPNLVRQGQVGFTDVANAFNMMTNEGGLFFNMMSRVNKETVYGRWQNLVENFQLMAKDLGQAAFEGLKVHDVLTDIADSFRGTDKGGATEFFSNIRKTAEMAWIVLKRVYNGLKEILSPITSGSESVREWYKRNEKLISTLVTIAASVAAATVAIKLFALTVKITMLVLSAFKSLLVAVSLVSFVANVASSVIGWIITLGPAAPAVIGLIALTAALAGLVSALGALDHVGRNWTFGSEFMKNWKEIQSILPDVWSGIKEAFAAGDLEGTLDIVWESIKLGWKMTVNAMKIEFRNFIADFGGDLMSVHMFPVHYAAKQLAMQTNIPRLSGLSDEQVGQSMDALFKQKNMANRAGVRIGMDAMFPMDDHAAEIAAQRQKLMETVRSVRTKAVMDPTARNIFDQVVEPWMAEPDRGKAFNLLRDKSTFFSSQLPGKTAGLSALGGVPGTEAVTNTYANKWFDVMEAVHKVAVLGQENKFGTPEMEAASSNLKELVKSLDSFSAELQKTDTALKTLIKGVAAYPEEVTHMARDLHKEMLEGISPMDKYEKTLNRVNWAFRGPLNVPSGPAMAALGVPFVQGDKNFKGLFNEDERDFARFKAFEELTHGVQDKRGEGVAAMQFGSREAADTIARANTQQLSVLEQVNQAIRDGNEISKAERDYMRQVAEVMERMEKGGGGNKGGPAADPVFGFIFGGW